jgi:dTDP-glucose 4,6-dehydratase
MKMKILVTGGAGFIASNFIRRMVASNPGVHIVNVDKLTYSGNLENLDDIAQDSRHEFIRADIADATAIGPILAQGFDVVVNFAAETHVDRSIEDAAPFITTNILGTQVLLEAARRSQIPRFVQISTDEVYGSAPAGESFTEQTPLDPRSPYSASKASADLLVNAYVETFGLNAVILRCTNNYGPYQFPEKLIPLMISNALEDKSLPVYGDGLQERDWLYVEDYCRAIERVISTPDVRGILNVSSGSPTTNISVVRTILQILNKPDSLIQYVKDRPGHDRRYALDSSKFRKKLGWEPEVAFADGIKKTVAWYLSSPEWLARARSGEYRTYYERHYLRRDKTFA